MNQKNKDVMELVKKFKDTLQKDMAGENIKIVDIQYAGQLEGNINDNREDNNIFIVEVVKVQKNGLVKESEKTFKRYYLGTKCIGADIGNDEPILTQEISNKDEIIQAIKNKENTLKELEQEQMADVLSQYLEKKVEVNEVEECLKEINNEKENNQENELNESQYKRARNIQSIQKIDMDKKINENETIGQRLEMQGYTELYVIRSGELKEVMGDKNTENQINNNQYLLVGISTNGNAEIVNDMFFIDKDPMKALTKIESNEMVREDNKDEIQLKRKTNDAVLGIEDRYDGSKVFVYEKDVENNPNVGLEIETTEMVKNNHVVDKKEVIYDAQKTKNNKENVNPNAYIPGTQITWSQFASECGYRGEGAIERAVEEFYLKKESNPELDNTTLTNEIVEEKEEDYRSQTRSNYDFNN